MYIHTYIHTYIYVCMNHPDGAPRSRYLASLGDLGDLGELVFSPPASLEESP